MITRFYKILNKNKDVIYVGVTTRTLKRRFKEHLIAKRLNFENYSIVEFDRIVHPEFTTIEVYYREREKVARLEQKYIKEELLKGSHLLNLSIGGEWGSSILNKLRKADFLEKYGSYDGYKEHIKKKMKVYHWMCHWYEHKSENSTKVWINSWIFGRTLNNLKKWLKNWVYSKSKHNTKSWLQHWTSHRKSNNIKGWLHRFIRDKSINKTKAWTNHWIDHRGINKIKRWLQHWVDSKSTNKTKAWLKNWIINRRD